MQSFKLFLEEEESVLFLEYGHRATKKFIAMFNDLPTIIKKTAQEKFKKIQIDPRLADFKLMPQHGPNVVQADAGYHYRALGVKEGDNIVWYWIGTREELNGGGMARGTQLSSNVPNKTVHGIQKPLAIT